MEDVEDKLVENVEDSGAGSKLVVEDDVVEVVDKSTAVPRCAAFPRAADVLQMSCSSLK